MNSRNVRVACVQTTARDVGQAELALTEALDGIDSAARTGARLVVLPECTYPAYMLRGWADPGTRAAARDATARAAGAFADRAREHGCHIAVGLAEVTADAVYNSLYLFDPSGGIAGRARKHFLWHFDSRWFSQGAGFDVIDAPWGKTGMLICADGRMPEVMRMLCLKGARIVIDATNWTASGKDPSRLTNPQVEYMMRTRALENRAWIVAADKVGTEQESVVYCGSSCIVSPDGRVVARASSDRPEVITADIDAASLSPAAPPPVDGRFDPLEFRRPGEYLLLKQASPATPAEARLHKAVVPAHSAAQIAVAQAAWNAGDARRAAEFIHMIVPVLSEQDAAVAVFPEPPGAPDPRAFEPVLAAAIDESRRNPHMSLFVSVPEAADSGRPYKTCFWIAAGEIAGRYRKLHLELPEKEAYQPGDLGLPVFETPAGLVGVMMGYEGLLPEVGRVLTLGGADLIAWPACFGESHYDHVARTRAAENRVFVAMSNEASEGTGESLVADPSGAVVCQAFRRTRQAISALCNMSMAMFKLLVPNTDVIAGRLPGSYAGLSQ